MAPAKVEKAHRVPQVRLNFAVGESTPVYKTFFAAFVSGIAAKP